MSAGTKQQLFKSFLERRLPPLVWLSVLALCAAYIVIPMRQFQSEVVELQGRSYRLVLFFFAYFATVGVLLFRWARESGKGNGVTARETQSFPKWAFAIVIGAASLLVWRTFGHLESTPMSWDEMLRLSQLGMGWWLKSVDPTYSHNHIFSNIATIGSSELFGYTKFGMRLPALLFTTSFLVLLAFFCFRHASVFTAFLIFANLAFSENIVFYMHSARGYISFLAMTVIQLMLAKEFVQNPDDTKKIRWIAPALATTFFLSHFFHGLGPIFSFILFNAVFFWGVANRKSLTDVASGNFIRMMAWCLTALALVSPFQFSLANQTGATEIPAFSLEQFSMRLGEVLGMSRVWYGKLIFFAISGLLLVRLYWTRHRVSFETALGVTSLILLFVFSQMLFGEACLRGRYALAYAVPLLFVFGEHLNALKRIPIRRASQAVALALLFLGPFLAFRKANFGESEASGYLAFDSFMNKIVETTSPTKENCYFILGSKSRREFARYIYLNADDRTANCSQRYLAVIGFREGRHEDYSQVLERIYETNPQGYLKPISTDGYYSYAPAHHDENRYELYEIVQDKAHIEMKPYLDRLITEIREEGKALRIGRLETF